MGVVREISPRTSLLEKKRITRNLFSSPKQSTSVYSDVHQQTNEELNDRVAERFLIKRTKRSYDLSVVSKRNSTMHMLRSHSEKLDGRQPAFFLGPKVPSSPEDRRVFATPKRYICEACNAKLLNVTAYVKHLRKHKRTIQCSGCSRTFAHVIYKRRHELTCPKTFRSRF